MSRVFARKALIAVLAMTVSIGAVSAEPAWASEPFGIEAFENTITTEGGEPVIQAGSHPYAMATTVVFNNHKPTAAEEREGFENAVPDGNPKEVQVNLPAGIVVNPAATTQKCTEAELEDDSKCPAASAVGVAKVKVGLQGIEGTEAVYNMVPPPGVPAEFAFLAAIEGIYVHMLGGVRTGGDYGLSARVSDISQFGAVYSAAVTLWGDPSAESHVQERGACAHNSPKKRAKEEEQYYERVKEAIEKGEPIPTESEFFLNEGERPVNCPVESTGKALLTMPSSCTSEPLKATVSTVSWQESGAPPVKASAESPAVTGCENLGFGPILSVQPVEPSAPASESPTGLEVELKVPQEEGLERYGLLAKSDLKEASVTLPAGVTVSPSAANSLGACSEAQIGLNNADAPSCSDNSKLGTVEVVTPLLEAPLKGSVYLAEQGNMAGAGSNPFGSLFALYLVAEGSGTLVKLPGEVRLDPVTGQVSARFGKDPTTGFYLPQLPFSELKMRLFGGPRAPLMIGVSCGTFTTSSVLTPWDGNAATEPSSSFAVGERCSPFGFTPTFTAGMSSNRAGGYSPFSMTLSRGDGEQRLAGVQVTTPPGLLGMLSKVSLCQEPQASQGTCGEASNIGETTEAVGPGEDPYWAKGGHVYLTGPYNNEPFGLSIVVPTVAGPFTLAGNGGPGREIVRASIAVNPKTGALTVASGQLPTMLEGVPLDIRTINVDINRREFTFNPTNCEELHVTSSIISTEGATATPSSRFQVADCATLPFKPSLVASTRGNGSDRGNGASLHVKVTQRTGEAGIRSVHLELPRGLPARLSTLQKACTEATFDANPANCPSSSDVGTGIAHTPVLPVALEGPAYFVSHGGAAYPELVFVLQGDGVRIDLAGETRIVSKTNITSSTFGTVPDAPISSFEANLPEGPDSALGTLTPKGLCGSSGLLMPTTIVGQNGAEVHQSTKIAVTGCSSKSGRKEKRKRAPKATRNKHRR
jgi:hypothetical protein